MASTVLPAKASALPRMFDGKRVRAVLLWSAGFGVFMGLANWHAGFLAMLLRTMVLGLVIMTVFGLFERWPRRLPRWVARWVVQVVAVGVVIPPATALIFALSNGQSAQSFYEDPVSMQAFSMLAGLGVLFGPWLAVGALVRQKDALARNQALAFALERSELEREALDARLRVLQGQVAPHFLFNTLANVQALVDAGSPQATAVLKSLIAYLRAAVPRLDEPVSTIGQELDLVRAYLELMHLRMPDRLRFTIDVDKQARGLRCPPMTLLTLVENAVRHGIDPGEEGGRIDLHAQRRGDRLIVRVSDTGVGLTTGAGAGGGLGTGLATLRERLRLTFGDDAHLRVSAQQPRGVCAELDLPAQGGA